MPSLSGVQVLKRIRAREVNIPVIFYSDYSTYKDDFTSWLADAYLVKSSDLTKLKEKIKELLNLEGQQANNNNGERNVRAAVKTIKSLILLSLADSHRYSGA